MAITSFTTVPISLTGAAKARGTMITTSATTTTTATTGLLFPTHG